MKWIVKKFGVLLMSCCMLVFLSCSTDSETDVNVEDENTEVNLVLKKVNFQFEGDDGQNFIEFSETGLPVSGSVNTFSYDSENRLIENTFLGGFGSIMPRSYIYEENILVGLNTPSIGSSDGVSIQQGDILYEDGNRVIHSFNDGGLSYNFTDDTFNHILSLGRYEGDNSSNLFKRYDYVYDSEINLVLVNEYDMDETTGEEIHRYTYDIEYDTKMNPYYKFQEHHPIVFNLLGFDFDSSTLNFIEPHLRRNAKHNVISILRTRLNDGSEYIYSFDYDYNEDDYPTLRYRYHGNGNLLNTLHFEYY